MTATILSLRPPSELAGFLRLGYGGYRKLEELRAAGRLHFRRIVIEAAYFLEHRDLIRDLQADGCETVLDPNFAEMAAIGRYNASSLQKLPWAKPGRPWSTADFDGRSNFNLAKAIAEFAVAADVSAVLAPSHLDEGGARQWHGIDMRLCEALREELDNAGGRDIAIDFQWIVTGATLREPTARKSIVTDLLSSPVENLWIRSTGFGAKATGAGTRHYVEALGCLHEAGKPIISDMAGGFAGLAAMALGGSAALSHGIGVKESFNLASWKKPKSGSIARQSRIYIAEIDRYLTEPQLASVFAARGGKTRVGCLDRGCCPRGPEDMIARSDAHFLQRRHTQIEDLSAVPAPRRTQHFLDAHLDPAIREARLLGRMDLDEQLNKVIVEAKVRLERLRETVAHQGSEAPLATHARAPRFRGGGEQLSAVLRQ